MDWHRSISLLKSFVDNCGTFMSVKCVCAVVYGCILNVDTYANRADIPFHVTSMPARHFRLHSDLYSSVLLELHWLVVGDIMWKHIIVLRSLKAKMLELLSWWIPDWRWWYCISSLHTVREDPAHWTSEGTTYIVFVFVLVLGASTGRARVGRAGGGRRAGRR